MALNDLARVNQSRARHTLTRSTNHGAAHAALTRALQVSQWAREGRANQLIRRATLTARSGGRYVALCACGFASSPLFGVCERVCACGNLVRRYGDRNLRVAP